MNLTMDCGNMQQTFYLVVLPNSLESVGQHWHSLWPDTSLVPGHLSYQW